MYSNLMLARGRTVSEKLVEDEDAKMNVSEQCYRSGSGSGRIRDPKILWKKFFVGPQRDLSL